MGEQVARCRRPGRGGHRAEAARINEAPRPILHIGIAVPGLARQQVSDHRVGRQEALLHRVIDPAGHVDEAELVVVAMAAEADQHVREGPVERFPSRFDALPERIEVEPFEDRAAVVKHQADGAERVTLQVAPRLVAGGLVIHHLRHRPIGAVHAQHVLDDGARRADTLAPLVQAAERDRGFHERAAAVVPRLAHPPSARVVVEHGGEAGATADFVRVSWPGRTCGRDPGYTPRSGSGGSEGRTWFSSRGHARW